MKKRWLYSLLALIAALMCAAPALAVSGSVDLNELPGYTDGTVPDNIPDPGAAIYLADTYPSWELEDYILYPGLTDKDYAFALVERDGARQLIGFRGAKGEMKRWFRSRDGVPQGKGEASFLRDTDGWFIVDEQGRPELTVRLVPADSEAEWDTRWVTYTWNGSAFRLARWYQDRTLAEVSGDRVSYYDLEQRGENGGFKLLGRASGTLQKDIRYVSFHLLPKTLSKARQDLSDPPRIPVGDLAAMEVRFTGGKVYDVYSGPGEQYLRGADGRAAVSTNDWIQVFGRQNGWVMVQYDVSSGQYRIGWIRDVALPEGADVPEMYFDETPMYLTRTAALTDDPMNSGEMLAKVQAGTVTHLADMGDHAYIETEVSGMRIRGFVLRSLLEEMTK